MAPNKFENQIKKELSNRSIAPSAQAWDRLDAMLAVAENKTTKNSNTVLYKWIGIAALITIVFSIVVWNTSQTNQNSTAPNQNIVTTQKSTIEKYDSLPNAIPTKIENTVANPFFKEKRKIAYKPTIENLVQEHNSLSNTQQEIKNTSIADNNIDTNILHNTKTVTVDADELLLSVEQNHTKKTNYRVKLNTNTLLAHADNEVELTFRENAARRTRPDHGEGRGGLQGAHHRIDQAGPTSHLPPTTRPPQNAASADLTNAKGKRPSTGVVASETSRPDSVIVSPHHA